MSTNPSSDIVIDVQGASKRYDIYTRNADKIKHLLSLGSRHYGRPFWALKDVSFQVRRGEAVGIMGRNGSGKSTLMQIIAGTLSPTEGTVTIAGAGAGPGRVSALLELGSGFNPQFTGRENVYLSASIMGLSRREIDDKFAAIAAFADIGDFLEQPVELYSSGMYARLAFSVAACVEPDVLIVDEILSVGDAGFQQRCVARLRQMLDNGLTLLFVSHSADMVKSICSRGLFIQQGQMQYFGDASEAVDQYMHSLRHETTQRAQENVAHRKPQLANSTDTPETALETAGLRSGTGHGRIRSIRLLDQSGKDTRGFLFAEPVTVEASVEALVDMDRLDLVIVIRDRVGADVFGTTAVDEKAPIGKLAAGEQATIRFQFTNHLAPGPHGVALTFNRRPDFRGEGVITLDHLDTAAAFDSLPDKRIVRGRIHVQVSAEICRAPAVTPGSTESNQRTAIS